MYVVYGEACSSQKWACVEKTVLVVETQWLLGKEKVPDTVAC